jgi:hypothetical protein
MRDAILDLAVSPGIFTEEQIGQIRSVGYIVEILSDP